MRFLTCSGEQARLKQRGLYVGISARTIFKNKHKYEKG